MTQFWSRKPSRPVRRHRLSHRPRLELLEERCVLAATSLAPQLLLTTTDGAVQTVKLNTNTDVSAALADYKSRPGIASAEVDQVVSVQTTPNDTYFTSQYDLNHTGQSGGTAGADISAPAAWNLATGTGRVTVGVIDTGIDYRHPDLYLNVWINQGEIPSNLGVVDTDGD